MKTTDRRRGPKDLGLTTFKVAAISSNTDSFGNRSHILVASNGTACQVLRSAYSPGVPEINHGDLVDLHIATWGRIDYTRPLPLAPADAVKELWNG